jgi:hypothetical protein
MPVVQSWGRSRLRKSRGADRRYARELKHETKKPRHNSRFIFETDPAHQLLKDFPWT